MAPALATCAAVAAAVAFRSAAALKAEGSGRRFVEDIAPESYDDIVRKVGDTEGMVHLHIRSFDGSEKNVSIMGYPAKEDKDISASLSFDSNWETSHTRSLCNPWSNHLRGNFLDIGTNIGTYSLPMASCMGGGNGSVLSVEGMPDIADHYRAGVVANGARNVALYPYAVGGAQGPDFVTMTLDPENKGGSSVLGNKEGDASLLKKGVREVQVPLTTVDSMLKVDPRFKAVLSAKIDIEGNEGRMFQGAEAFFSQHAPCYIMVELIHEWLTSAGTPIEDILAKLTEWGYKNVPSVQYMKNCRWRSRTIHLQVKDMVSCTRRVEEAYAASL